MDVAASLAKARGGCGGGMHPVCQFDAYPESHVALPHRSLLLLLLPVCWDRCTSRDREWLRLRRSLGRFPANAFKSTCGSNHCTKPARLGTHHCIQVRKAFHQGGILAELLRKSVAQVVRRVRRDDLQPRRLNWAVCSMLRQRLRPAHQDALPVLCQSNSQTARRGGLADAALACEPLSPQEPL